MSVFLDRRMWDEVMRDAYTCSEVSVAWVEARGGMPDALVMFAEFGDGYVPALTQEGLFVHDLRKGDVLICVNGHYRTDDFAIVRHVLERASLDIPEFLNVAEACWIEDSEIEDNN